MDFLLIFVDEIKKEIYGNLFSELEKEEIIKHKNKILKYPLIQKDIIYFPLKKMVHFDNLSNEEAKLIWEKNTMNKLYKNKNEKILTLN